MFVQALDVITSCLAFWRRLPAATTLAAIVILAGCEDDREGSLRVGIAVGNPSVSYPIVATIVKGPSSISELFLLNLEDGSVRRRRPAQLNPNSITDLVGEKVAFLLTAVRVSGSSYATIKYDFFADREQVLWESGQPIRLPFQLGGRVCAWQPSKYTPKGQAMALSPICGSKLYPSAVVPSADQLIMAKEKAIVLQDFADSSSVF